MEKKHTVLVSVDPVIFTVFDGSLQILLVKRNIDPFKGVWSLPGGLIDNEQDLDSKATALRKLREKTNVNTAYLEQVGTVDGVGRDPRGWSMTVVYYALINRPDVKLKATHGADEVRWFPVDKGDIAVELAFDHKKLVKMALERLRAKVSYTSIAARLTPEPFSFIELKQIYEIILGHKVDKKTLIRRYLEADILVNVSEKRDDVVRRGPKAELYRLRDRKKVHFFVRNIEGPREE